MTVSVRDATSADIAAIVAIERMSFSDPWTRGMFGSHLVADSGNGFLVADDENCVVGFAITQTVGDESELLNIAVAPSCQRRGIGALLLDSAMDRCRNAGALEMWLEVRASNTYARILYEARGFAGVGVRKRYYQAPREDAIVLRADLRTVATGKGIETVTRADLSLTTEPVDSILSPASHFPRQEPK